MNSPSEEQLFDQVLELPPPARREFLMNCCDDVQMVESVLRLAEMHDTDDAFLATPAVGISPAALFEQPGDQVACYELIEPIGEGGFGTVWKARQQQPLQRDVALKIIKLGLNSSEILDRFEIERQALALMSHPNIATVLDAGVTDCGRPFFAMELVDGVHLDRFAADHRLPEDQLLTLFIAVCRGVEHAHQKGIVHRDLKPGNVLVVDNAGQPLPKVIDFGIAKAMSRSNPGAAKVTAESRVGTLDFMSPEQLNGAPDIDVRSDVFALGRMLHRLLAKRLPAAGSDDSGADDPAKHSRLIENRELNCIIQKATAPDRAGRYPSVSALVNDIHRYLGHQPVAAHPPSRLYAAQKFVQRNRILTTAAVLVTAAALFGIASLVVGISEANRQRTVAETKRQEAEEQREIAAKESEQSKQLTRILKQVALGAIPLGDKEATSTRREQLNELAATLPQLDDYPEVESELRSTFASAYHNLSMMEEAADHYERALILKRQLYGDSDRKTLHAQVAWAACLSRLTKTDQAESELLAVLEQINHHQKATPLRLAANKTLARIRARQLRIEEAFELYQRCVADAAKVYGRRNRRTLDLLADCGAMAVQLQHFEQAESMSRESLEHLEQKYPEQSFLIANTRTKLARVLYEQKKFAETEPQVRTAVDEYSRILGANDEHTIKALSLLADTLMQLGQSQNAEKTIREAVARVETVPDNHHTIRATVYRRLAQILEPDQPEAASAAWETTIAHRTADLGVHPQVASHLIDHASVLQRLNQTDAALTQLARAIDILDQLDGNAKLKNRAVTRHQALMAKGKKRNGD